MPDEKPGLIPTTEWKKKRTGDIWRGGDTFINSIGQGFVLVSPIQACQLMSVVANGGYFYRPTLLKRSRNRETGEVRTYSTDLNGKITIDPKALEEVRQALAGVVAEPGGTGHAARDAARDRGRKDRDRPGHRAKGRRPETFRKYGGPCVVRRVRARR